MAKPVAGAYNWRRALVDLIRHERAELDDLLRLMEAAATPETGKLIRKLIDGKHERIELLYQLRGFEDPTDNGSEDEDA